MPAPIDVEEYRRRRERLMASVAPDSAILVPAAGLSVRNHDSDYPFRQSSNFHYLCGFPEPDAWLVLLPGREAGESVLFCQPRDPAAETWTGRRVGPRRAVKAYGVDEAWSLEARDEQLLTLLEGRRTLYLPLDNDAALSLAGQMRDCLKARERRGPPAPSSYADIDEILHEQRLIKSEAELALMRHAGEITARAHVRAMQCVRPGMFEYQLQAIIEHAFAMEGARAPAYGTIVGSGANACILHYMENDAVMAAGDLVLIDAGAEYGLYAGDITRTFPVSGRFSEPQRQLYEIVLGAQQRALRAVRPGATLESIHDGVVRDLTAGLVALGLVEGPVETAIEQGHYKRFYLHGTSHWLGLDVHDVGRYRVDGASRALVPGMVLTVEPGLYIPDDPDIAEQWRGIGIRIEDNVVVTAEGRDVLTEGVPKRVREIEALMAQGHA
ncbi:Xaa-Pro aminopeptidase [Kushneria pakistanensis]|uniref:Xaa-Pro aminopeptidase n=1 Tax=Kushneria pakistanensis TaxID=1508770 RepID=A0ABQ3FHP0_9GAMM|nr:Xaa-Pro aminopeptidase [Kushneria pakistanensis]GHC24240.1 Xaa-Pro aminopeptidase [Kushneria pakistanensis]